MIGDKWDSYKDYLESPEWQAKRSERLRIDGFKCQICGRPMDLNVHHITYDNIGNENVYTDLITLCKFCHEKIEKSKKAYYAAKDPEWEMQKKKWKEERERREHEHEHNLNAFIEMFKDKDYVYGGSENLCNLNVIKKYWNESGLPGIPPCEDIISYFRDRKIEFIYKLKRLGASQDYILSKGISYAMVRKYYNNQALAEKIVGHKL